MEIELVIKCEYCGKRIIIILEFGEREKTGERYPHTRRPCPHCGRWFGIVGYSAFSMGSRIIK